MYRFSHNHKVLILDLATRAQGVDEPAEPGVGHGAEIGQRETGRGIGAVLVDPVEDGVFLVRKAGLNEDRRVAHDFAGQGAGEGSKDSCGESVH